MNRDVVRQLVNVVAFVATVVVNGMAVALPLNGQDTGAIADLFRVYFVPADYVFSIWSLIYLLLLAFVAYQALPGQRENRHLRRIGYLFVLTCVANTVWIFLWHYLLFALSLVAMFVLLASLVAIYLRLDVGRATVSRPDRWFVHLPFSVYLGWITVATIANVTSVLYYWRWSGWGLSAEAWTAIMLAIAVGIAAVVTATRRDWAYLLVLVWAFAGIAVKHADTSTVASAAWLAAAATAVMAVVAIVSRLRDSDRVVASGA